MSKANTPHLAAALGRAGIGKIVLPLFAAENMQGLTRLSDPNTALHSEQWLVSHHDARKEPPIRAALDAIASYLSGKA